MQRRTLSLVAVALLALTSVAAAGGAAVAQQDDSGLTYEELSRNGEVVSSEYPSVRQVDGEGVWLARYPPSGLSSYGSSPSREFIEPSDVIRRDRVRLFTGEYGAGGTDIPLKVAYWTREQTERTVTEGNTTTTQTVTTAEVIAVDDQTVSLTGTFQAHGDVSIRKFPDQTVRATIWSPEYPGMRWTMKVNTLATAAPVNIGSQGDLQGYIIWWVALPSIISTLGGQMLGALLNRRGGAGPNRRGRLIGGGLFVAFGFWAFGYVQLSSLIASLPLAWAFAIGWVSFAWRWDDNEDVESVAFLRLDTREMPSPLEGAIEDDDELSQEDATALEAISGEMADFDIVTMPDGEKAIYEPGFDAWYARFKGLFTELEVENQQAEIDLEDGSTHDKLVLIDQNEDYELIQHTPEQTITAWPWKTHGVQTEDRDEPPTAEETQRMAVLPGDLGVENYVKSVGVLAAFGVACYASGQILGSWLWGVAAYVPLRIAFTKPVKGYARTRVAPGLARAAWATAFYQKISMTRFGSMNDMARKIIELENRDQDLIEALKESRDETTITQDSASTNSNPMDSSIVDEDPTLGKTAEADD